MLTESKTTEKKKIEISNIQKWLFYGLLFITPLSIFPFSWDWTERGMALVIFFIGTIIVTLEVIKIIKNGKATFLKSAIDGGILAVLISMILSTLFSKDLNTSLWGMDARLGTGLLAFISVILVALCARTFIKGIKEIKYCLLALTFGLSIINILSLLSFLGINVWGFIPIYKELNQTGLPLFRSSKVHLLINFVLLLIDFGFAVDFLIDRTKKNTLFTIAMISAGLAAINVWVFSMNQGIGMIISFIVLVVLLWVFGIRKIKVNSGVAKNILIFMIIYLLIVLIPTVILQIPALRNVIIPSSINVVAQVSLGADVSWIIAASVFVASFVNGLVGMGVDTYSMAYNLYKPLSQNLLAYNDVNFYYSCNQVFTNLATGGLIWLLAWGFMGFVIVRMLRKDIAKVKIYKDEIGNGILFLMLDFVILFIYISSFFSIYSVLVLLILFTVVTLRSVLLEVLNKETGEKFVIKLWTANLGVEDTGRSETNKLGLSLIILSICIGSGLLVLWSSKIISSVYLLKAESYYIEQNNKYADTDPTIEERNAFVNSMVSFYTTSAQFDEGNPVINRKLGSMYLELVGIAAEEYSNDGSSNSAELISNVGKWKNYALDYTRKSIDTDNAVYDNWEARARVYMGLVGMGFTDYVSDTLYSLEQAESLNPLNYELYYDEAQIYVISKDYDSALASLTKELGINAQHIPSLVLAAEINKTKGNTDVYESYLKAAKKILESNGQTDTDIYEQISQELNAISTTD